MCYVPTVDELQRLTTRRVQQEELGLPVDPFPWERPVEPELLEAIQKYDKGRIGAASSVSSTSK